MKGAWLEAWDKARGSEIDLSAIVKRRPRATLRDLADAANLLGVTLSVRTERLPGFPAPRKKGRKR